MIRASLLVCAMLSLVGCGQQEPESSVTAAGSSRGGYPLGPNPEMTPGVVCSEHEATETRYAEHIAYCSRDVSSGTKKEIIRDYDSQLGFNVGGMNRGEFKIDHYIPLCMGGANAVANLWPQHRSVYTQTDPIEQKLCELMARGHLKQVDAIAEIKRVKNNLDEAQAMVQDLDNQLR